MTRLTLERPLAFIDLETTGINVGSDRIVEIAILKLNPDGSKTNRTHRVNPEMPISEESTSIHGISNEDDEYQNLSDTNLSSTVQQEITDYINENHTGGTITEVEIENQIIEIELSGNTELSFTLSGDYLTTEVDDEDDQDDDDSHDEDDNDDENDQDDDDSDDEENEYSSLSSSNLSQAVQQLSLIHI